MRQSVCLLRGGPADGNKVLFVRPSDGPTLYVGSFGVRLGESGPSHEYELDDAEAPAGCHLVYTHQGVAVKADDEEEAAAMAQWAERFTPFAMPDGTAGRKTRVFINGGPMDGALFVVVYPESLSLAGLTTCSPLEEDAATTPGYTGVYEIVPAWQERADWQTADAVTYQYTGREPTPATAPGSAGT